MSPSDNSMQASPVPKRLQFPVKPSLNRTTSQLSAVSVEAQLPNDGPRQLLSRSLSKSTLSPADGLSPLTSPTRHRAASSASNNRPTAGASASSSRTSSLYDNGTLGFSARSPSPSTSLAGVDKLSFSEANASVSEPQAASPETRSRASSRKGKERALDDAAVNQVDVSSEMATVSGEGSTKGLRELVRRSTAVELVRPGTSRSRATSVEGGFRDLPSHLDRTYTPRRYYVLTNAGKPVYRSQDDSSEDNITNLMGVAQALISIFAEDDDRLRYITKGRHRLAFVLKAPLYLFCVSDWGEPEHVLRMHLDYIHLQILSVVSSTQLSRVFQRRSNFDLSRLLEGTEMFVDHLIDRCQFDFSYLASTLQPLRMAPALRDTAAAALMPPSRIKDLLYVLLIAGGHIVTLLRPRKHSIHPSDLHLLLNTLESSATLRSSEAWLPICFPKFNPAGFVHAYVSYPLEDVGLVFVSADREAFEELRAWKAMVLENLEKDRTLVKIEASIPSHPYTVSAVGCPGLRHFIYKSRQNVQITAPVWEEPYEENNTARKRLITLYQRLYDAVHARSGQSAPLKLVFIRSDHEACLAWVTRPFELYLAISPHLSKAAVVAAANSIARWISSEEGKIILKDAPVF